MIQAILTALCALAAGGRSLPYAGEALTALRPSLSSDTVTTVEGSVELELAGILVPERDPEPVFTLLGLSYSPYRFLVSDIGAVVGLNDEAPDFGVVLGTTHNLGLVTRRRSR